MEALETARMATKDVAHAANQAAKARQVPDFDFDSAVQQVKQRATALQQGAAQQMRTQKLAHMQHELTGDKKPAGSKQHMAAKKFVVTLQDQYQQLEKKLQKYRKPVQADTSDMQSQYAKLQKKLQH